MSELTERTRAAVVADPSGNAATGALDGLSQAEGPDAARAAALAARKELLSRGNYDGAEAVFFKELGLAPDAPQRAGVLAEMGRFYRDFRRDKAKAIDCFLKAFEMDTTRMELLEEVGQVYTAKESFDDLVTRLHEEAKKAPDAATAARWHAEMADVSFKLLDRPEDALRSALDAIRLDASNARARTIAEGVLLHLGKWADLADLYRRLARETSDPNERVAILFRLAATWRDKLHDPLRTMETYEEIVSVAPNNIRIYSLIDELKGDRPTWQKVAEELVTEAKGATLTDDAALNWALAGKVYLKYLADDVSAADCYLALLKADPEMPAALKALRELSTRLGDPRVLARGLAEAAEGAKTPARKRDLFRELGMLYRGPLAAPSLASRAFAAALELDPQDAASAEALEALYAELGEWEQLAEHLRKRVTIAQPHWVPSLLARLGEVLAERLGSPAAAVEAYEDGLKLDAQHRPSLLALERLYKKSESWQNLARVYRGLGETSPDTSERIRVHKALAAVSLEHLHDIAGAVSELEEAIKLDRADVETWQLLETAYSVGEKWEELLRIYGSLPDDAPFKELARSWYRKAAEICARRMGDPEKAALWYRRARMLEPGDATLRDALAQQYQAAGKWTELVELLEEQATSTVVPAEQTEALLRAGGVAEEKIGSLEQARGFYERAAATAPGDPSPLKCLERVYLRGEVWEKLAEVYAAQARIGRDVETRAAALRRLARVERDKLKRAARAAEAFQALSQLVPDDREAIDALRTLLADQRRWQELLATHGKALQLATDPRAKAQILREMADLLRGELRDPDGALDSLEQALALEPDDRSTLDHAADLYAVRRRWREFIDVRTRALPHVPPAERPPIHLQIAKAAQGDPAKSDLALARRHYQAALELDPKNVEAMSGLRKLLAGEGDAKGMAALAERELALGPPPARRAELYRELGALHENELGDPARALTCYQAASDIDDADVEALSGMRRLLAARGSWAEYAKVAELEAARTKDRAQAAELHRQLAALWGTRFGQPSRAAGHLRRVLEILPHDREALMQLADTLEETGESEELDRVLGQLAESPDSESGERAWAFKRRADLAAGPLNRPDEAITLYRRSIELAPDDVEALGSLAKLLEAKQAWRELLPVLQARRRLLPHGKDRGRTLKSLGDLWRSKLANAANAAEAYREALQEHPDAAVVTHLAEVVEDANTFRTDLARAAELAPAGQVDPDVFAPIDAAAGKAFLGRFRMPELAAEYFAKAVEREPRLSHARAGLEHALEEAEKWDELADALEKGAEIEPLTAAKRLAKAALVARDKLADSARAMKDLEAAVAKRPEILGAGTQEDRSARDALEALYARGRHWEQLKVFYTRALELAPGNPVERSPLRLGLGDLLRDRFAQPDEAKRQYELAASEDPRNAQAHESLATLALAVGDDLQYAKHAAAAAEALSPHPRAADWLRRAADACLRAGKAAESAELARRALALEPRDAAGLESLAAALREKAKTSGAREDWDELAKTLARRLALPAAATAPPAAAAAAVPANAERVVAKRGALARELAQIHAEQRDDSEEAARVWERALGERSAPEDADSDGRLSGQELSAALAEDLAVARDASAFFEKTERWSGLAIALGRVSEVAPEPERPDALRRLADVLAGKLGDRTAAARALERLSELKPEDLPALESLAKLYSEGRDWEKLLKVYERAAAAAKDDPAQAAEYLRTLAEVWEKRLNSGEGAASAFRRLLAILPEDVDGAEGLRRCLFGLGRWGELVAADEEAIRRSGDPARRASLWGEVARLKRDRLDDAAGAADAFGAMLSDPTLPTAERAKALEELGAVYVDLGRWKDAALVEQDRAAEAATSEDAAKRILAAATLLADRVGDVGAAIALIEEARGRPARSVMGGAPDAWKKEADAPKGKRRKNKPAPVETPEPASSPMREGKIPDAAMLEAGLESLYERAGSHADLEKLLSSRPQTPAIRLRRAALLAGPLARPDAALALYREAVEGDGTNRESAEAYRALARRERSRKDLRLAYETLLRQTTDPKEQAVLLCDSVDEALRGTAKAKMLERAAEVDPTCRRAVRALRERAERRRRWEEAATWLAKEEPLATDTADRAELLGRRAFALGAAKKGKEAIAVYKEALAVAPHRTDLLASLAEVAFTEENWEEAAKAYERLARAANFGDPKGAAELARRQGEIALRRKMPDEAIAHFQDALAHAPDDPQVLKPLARLYADRGQWKLVSKTLQVLLANANDLQENDRIEARLRAGEAYAKMGAPTAAAVEYRKVLDERPGHLDATLGLAEALASSGEGKEALAFLEKFAAETKDVERKRDALRRVGELRLAEKDEEGARAAFAEAVRADASDRRAVEALARLHAERGEWIEAIEALQELAAATPAGKARGQVYKEMAETYDTGLGDQLKARELYEKAQAESPGDPDVERALSGLLGRLGHWADLSGHLERRIAASPPGPAKLDLLIERGRILRDRLERPDDAAEVFGLVVNAAPERADARRERAKALSMTGRRNAEAIAEYLRLVTDDPADMDSMAGLGKACVTLGEEWRAEAASAVLSWAGRTNGGPAAAPASGDKRGSFVAASGARLDPALLRKHLVDAAETNVFFDALKAIEKDAPEVLAAIDADPGGPGPSLSQESSRLAEAGASIAAVLGATDPGFVSIDAALPSLLAGRPPKIGLPKAAPNPGVLFALGRAVDSLRDARHRLVLRDAAGVQGLFAALAAAALGDGAGGPASPDLVRSIRKTFGWRTKRTLRPILEPLAGRIVSFDFVGWRAAVGRTGARAGLLVCGDLQVALEIVGGNSPVEQRAERLRSDAAAADLVRWALSDDYAKIRTELLRSLR